MLAIILVKNISKKINPTWYPELSKNLFNYPSDKYLLSTYGEPDT